MRMLMTLFILCLYSSCVTTHSLTVCVARPGVFHPGDEQEGDLNREIEIDLEENLQTQQQRGSRAQKKRVQGGNADSQALDNLTVRSTHPITVHCHGL